MINHLINFVEKLCFGLILMLPASVFVVACIAAFSTHSLVIPAVVLFVATYVLGDMLVLVTDSRDRKSLIGKVSGLSE